MSVPVKDLCYQVNTRSYVIFTMGNLLEFSGSDGPKKSAIVNAANEICTGKDQRGIDKQFYNKGGKLLEKKRENYKKNAVDQKCPTGTSFLTSLKENEKWDFNVDHILHAVGPDYNNVTKSEGDQLLKSVYGDCLDKCFTKSISSVAFPYISSGIFSGKIDSKKIIELGITYVIQKLEESGKVINVIFYATRDTWNGVSSFLQKSDLTKKNVIELPYPLISHNKMIHVSYKLPKLNDEYFIIGKAFGDGHCFYHSMVTLLESIGITINGVGNGNDKKKDQAHNLRIELNKAANKYIENLNKNNYKKKKKHYTGVIPKYSEFVKECESYIEEHSKYMKAYNQNPEIVKGCSSEFYGKDGISQIVSHLYKVNIMYSNPQAPFNFMERHWDLSGFSHESNKVIFFHHVNNNHFEPVFVKNDKKKEISKTYNITLSGSGAGTGANPGGTGANPGGTGANPNGTRDVINLRNKHNLGNKKAQNKNPEGSNTNASGIQPNYFGNQKAPKLFDKILINHINNKLETSRKRTSKNYKNGSYDPMFNKKLKIMMEIQNFEHEQTKMKRILRILSKIKI